jgi:predicted nucleic acid-binding Zn ribbon protein
VFCTQCGTANRDDARFCSKCGRSLTDDGPLIAQKSAESGSPSNALWNPAAAANWSLIFTPAFGSYLQMLNWQTLGERERAVTARIWFYVSLAMLGVYVAIRLLTGERSYASAQPLLVLYLFVWYFASGRSQAKYVKERFGSAYPKKGWGKPILLGIAALVGYVLIGGIVVVLLT